MAADRRVTIKTVRAVDAHVADAARTVFSSIDAERRDDRFEGWPRSGTEDRAGDSASGLTGFIGAVATVDGHPVAFVGGIGPDSQLDGQRLALDALVDENACDAAGGGARVLTSVLEELVGPLDVAGLAEVELWARPATAVHDSVATSLELVPYRALHQMRCELPVDAEPAPTRAYTADDFEALRAVNNRAFATHPDQGGQTPERMTATMAESWFDPAAVRLHERDGRLAGFCWTKIHPSPPAPTELGEIYVIGVDPDFHGQGLGVPMTAAGLSWMSDKGITTGMLYVEADNVPAIRTYERLGFTVFRTDKAWIWKP